MRSPERIFLFLLTLTISVFFGCGRNEDVTPPKVPDRVAEPQASAASIPVSSITPVAPDRGADPVVNPAGGNRPPKIVGVPFKNPLIHRGIDIEVMPEALDPDGDKVTLRFEWFINGEKQAELNASILPGDLFRKGDMVALRIVPSDGKAEGIPFTSQPFAVPNAPPRFVSSPPLQFQAQNYLYEARAEDPDGDALTYNLEAGPSGMAIDAESGKVAWRIGPEQAGIHTVRIVAQDPEGMKAVQEYTLTIRIEQEGK